MDVSIVVEDSTPAPEWWLLPVEALPDEWILAAPGWDCRRLLGPAWPGWRLPVLECRLPVGLCMGRLAALPPLVELTHVSGCMGRLELESGLQGKMLP